MVGSGVIDERISNKIPEGNPSGISGGIPCVLLGGVPFKISGENYQINFRNVGHTVQNNSIRFFQSLASKRKKEARSSKNPN